MRYQGNVAYQLDDWQEQPARRSLRVHEGGHAIERARAAQTPSALIQLAVVLAVAFAVFGCFRIVLTAATVDTLGMLRVAESTVESERETRTELQMERSTLSSADRIHRIATENYGMVLASEVDTVSVVSADPEVASETTDETETGVLELPSIIQALLP